MPGQAPFHTDEHDLLLGYVAQQREVIRLTGYGLTDDQARRAAAVPSPLSVGGLIKHVTFVEQNWIDMILARERPATAGGDYADAFTMRADETLADLLDRSIAVGAETDRVVRAIPDLGQCVPVPQGVPWYPQDLDAWSVRWVLMHLVAGIARHAGHADIIREAVDGGTAFPIMAAAEGWPATPWMQPWETAAPKEDV
ncbi:MAG TPA: DinB family protein [Acidimicrobiia bacterium]|nr:DinB family protein [Acidimicrobiia bacterium]